MFCRYCGKQLKETDKFCSRCGKSTSSQSVQTQSAYESAPMYQNNNYNKPKKKMNPLLKAFVILLVFIFSAAFIFVFSAFVVGIIQAIKGDTADIDDSYNFV